MPPNVSISNSFELNSTILLSRTNLEKSLIPFPLISASDPSGLKTLIFISEISEFSTTTIPSLKTPK